MCAAPAPKPSSGLSGGMVACRFYIQLRGESSASQILGKPGGLIHAQTCSPAQSFADIKQKLWSKKNLRVNSSDYVFKLANAEATFDDQDPFAFFLFLNDLFREAPTKQSQANNPLAQQAAGAQRSVSPMPGAGPSPAAKDATPMLECVCLHRDDLADKSDLGKRQSKLAGVLQHQGPLSQRQDGLLGASWKERWGVVQDFNLFLFESEQAYTAANMSAVTDFFPLGCMIATRVEPAQADKQHPFCFELLSSRTPSSGSNRMSSGGTLNPKNADHKPNHFYTDSESSLLAWIGHINRLYLRRLKLMVLMAVESLDSRGLGTEGLFRISGNKTFVEALQLEFESGPGRFPNLDACDEHTITGTLKSALRNLPEPLLTFDQYPAFIRLAHDHPSSNTGPAETEARIEALRLVVARLPESNQGLLEFLMCFLARVADRASVNKMTPGNLSIVFTPNILRPRVESVTTVMQDAKAVLDVVEQMITHARTLWPQAVHTRRSLRANPLPAVLSPKSKGLPAPATGGIARPTPLPPPAGVARPTPLPPGKMPPPLASVVAPAPVAVTAATPAPVPVAAAPAAAAADPSLPAPPLPAKHKRVGSVPPPLPTTLRAETSSAAAPAPAPAAGAASPPAAAASSPGGNSVADRMRMFGSPRGPPPLPSPSASAAPSAVAPSSPAQQRTPPPPPAVAAVEVPVVEAPAAASPTPPAVASAPVSPASSMVVEEQPVLEVPRELLKMSRQTNAMGLRWSESMASAQRAMAEALAQLLDAHAALRDAGAVNHEAATSTVTTVQSCMEVLTSDLVRFEEEYVNLISFVEEQCKVIASSPELIPMTRAPSQSISNRPTRSAARPPPLPTNVGANAGAGAGAKVKKTSAAPPPLPKPVAVPAPIAEEEQAPAFSVIVSPPPPPEPEPAAAAEEEPAPSFSLVITPPADAAASSPAAAAAAAAATPRARVGDTVEAVFEYDGGSDSLSLLAGEKLVLLEGDEADAEWWCGRKVADGVEGFFPAAFVKLSQAAAAR